MGRKGRGGRGSSDPILTGGHRLGHGPVRSEVALPHGLDRVKEGGDGNCLFHALARQALGDTRLARRLREEVCDWMQIHFLPSSIADRKSDLAEVHKAEVATYIAEVLRVDSLDDTAVLRYVARMRPQGVWGTGLEALAACYLYKRPVHIWSTGVVSELLPPSSMMMSNADPMRLLHNGRNHWDSLVPNVSFSGAPASHSGPAARNNSDEDSALMRALSASLEAGAEVEERMLANAIQASCRTSDGDTEASMEVSPVVFVDENLVDNDRQTRRVLAISAAEERLTQANHRGLGSSARSSRLATLATESFKRANKPSQPGCASSCETPVVDVASTDSTAVLSAVTVHATPAGDSEARRLGRWRRPKASASDSAQMVAASEAIDVEMMDPVVDAMNLGPCVEALQRVGLSEAEAWQVIAQNDGDMEKVKSLYCIAWDESGRTVQMPFGPM